MTKITQISQMDKTGKNIFCPIDLHQRKMLAGIAVDRSGPVFHEFDTEWDGGVVKLINLLRALKKSHGGAEVWVAYEASGSGFLLADLLLEEGFKTAVLAPTKLPITPKSRSQKTDKKDVIRILEVMRGHVLAGNELPEVWIPSPQLRDHREVVRCRLDLKEELADIKNAIHGLLRRNGVKKPAGLKTNWTKKHVLWLHSIVDTLGDGVGTHLKSLLRRLSFYEDECNQLEQEVLVLAESETYRDQVKALTSIPGVGVLTAMVFLVELGDLNRFPNRRALGNYLGLVPRSWESGEDQDRKGRISKQGPPRVRKVLNQAAWALVRWDDWWKEWFEERAGKGKKKRKKKMVVAVMRRLGIMMWHQALAA